MIRQGLPLPEEFDKKREPVEKYSDDDSEEEE